LLLLIQTKAKGGYAEMWRNKKIIAITLLTVLLVVGSLGGVAFAQTGDDETGQRDSLLERVVAILVEDGVNITTDQLKDAFTQAKDELCDEAMDTRLQAMIDAGKITQEEANQMKEWLESKPDVSIGPRFRGRGGFQGKWGAPGMLKMHRFQAPTPPTE